MGLLDDFLSSLVDSAFPIFPADDDLCRPDYFPPFPKVPKLPFPDSIVFSSPDDDDHA